jgi:hypothetical protein
MTNLEKIKNLLGLKDSDSDDVLNTIVDLTEARLQSKIGESAVPDSLSYIVVEVSVARFNRIGSEGLASHSVEGESMSFSDDDFSKFENDIQAYIDKQDDATIGRVKFI